MSVYYLHSVLLRVVNVYEVKILKFKIHGDYKVVWFLEFIVAPVSKVVVYQQPVDFIDKILKRSTYLLFLSIRRYLLIFKISTINDN